MGQTGYSARNKIPLAKPDYSKDSQSEVSHADVTFIRSSRVVSTFGCQCRSRNKSGFESQQPPDTVESVGRQIKQR
jgi:hypothetical protein